MSSFTNIFFGASGAGGGPANGHYYGANTGVQVRGDVQEGDTTTGRPIEVVIDVDQVNDRLPIIVRLQEIMDYIRVKAILPP